MSKEMLSISYSTRSDNNLVKNLQNATEGFGMVTLVISLPNTNVGEDVSLMPIVPKARGAFVEVDKP